jgi:agmatine/peptidylarginine deiminase
VFLVEAVVEAGARATVLVDDAATAATHRARLAARRIPLDAVDFFEVGTDSLWVRDYIGRTVFSGARRQRVMVDFGYPYPGALYDDRASDALAARLGLPPYRDPPEKAVFLAWGDFLTDGQGTAFVSRLMLEHNRGDQARIEAALRDYLGISRLVMLDRLRTGPNNHIDMYMKLLDAETILVGEYRDAPDPGIAANVALLEGIAAATGRPYTIVRIPMPGAPVANDFRTYTNAILVNKTAIVPIYNLPTDEEALRIYREHLPGYAVRSYDCTGIARQRGVIRCVTSEIPAKD